MQVPHCINENRITNAAQVGLNSIIPMAKSRARGFKNIENFKAKVYSQVMILISIQNDEEPKVNNKKVFKQKETAFRCCLFL